MTWQNSRRRFMTLSGQWLVLATCAGLFPPSGRGPRSARAASGPAVPLPEPDTTGNVSVEAALSGRRTRRSYGSGSLTLDRLGQLAWAAQGITGPRGVKRAAPSAGATYPMDLYVVAAANGVSGLSAGCWHYDPSGHALVPVRSGALLQDVARACLGQSWMAGAQVHLVITAEYSRVTGKYGNRGVRYAHMEAGHIGENIFLQAEALGLFAGIVGAFDDDRLSRVLGLPADHEPLVVMPVGPAS